MFLSESVHIYYAKSKSEKKTTRELSDLVIIPQMQESIGYCMTKISPNFDCLLTAVDFHIQLVVEHRRYIAGIPACCR